MADPAQYCPPFEEQAFRQYWERVGREQWEDSIRKRLLWIWERERQRRMDNG
jgi:hypothetical protein